MADYTTISAVENYTLKEIDPAFQPQVTEWITGVSLAMDQEANRTLVAEDTDSELFFDGTGKTALAIDDYVTITSVEVGDVYGENFAAITDFVKYPAVAPFRRLIRREGYFDCGIQNVKVTGRAGYFAALPEDIKFAATVLVAGIINAQEPGASRKKSESIGNYSVSYTDEKGIADYKQALAIVAKYRRHSL